VLQQDFVGRNETYKSKLALHHKKRAIRALALRSHETSADYRRINRIKSHVCLMMRKQRWGSEFRSRVVGGKYDAEHFEKRIKLRSLLENYLHSTVFASGNNLKFASLSSLIG
jgi:hypothetical protein